MHFHWDEFFWGGAGEENGGNGGLDRYRTEGGVKWDDEQAPSNWWPFDDGNIECGNEMFLRCGFEGETWGAKEQGAGFNLAAKWRVWHVVTVQRTLWDTSPLHLLSANSHQAQQPQLASHVEHFGEWFYMLKIRKATFWRGEENKRVLTSRRNESGKYLEAFS